MVVGATRDRRAEAVALLRLIAERAEDPTLPLPLLGEIVQELATSLKEVDVRPAPVSGGRRLHVIEGGRRP